MNVKYFYICLTGSKISTSDDDVPALGRRTQTIDG